MSDREYTADAVSTDPDDMYSHWMGEAAAAREIADRYVGLIVDSYERDFRTAVRECSPWPDPRCLVQALLDCLQGTHTLAEQRERITYMATDVADELADERVIAPRAIADVRRRFTLAIMSQFGAGATGHA